MVQIIIFSLVALMLSSYGSPDSEQQSLENLQDNKEQWVSEIQLSGAYRLRGKGFALLSTPDGNFWVKEGRSTAGYKLIELDLSKSQPSALIQKGDQQAWIGLRSEIVPRIRVVGSDELEKRPDASGTTHIMYVVGESEPFTGMGVWYNKDGSKSRESVFENGKLHGTEMRYTKDGSKRFEIPYVDGKKHGMQVIYGTEFEYRNDGSRLEIPYENSKKHGTAISYYPNGTKRYEKPWVNGKGHGTAITYYEDGSKSSETPYVDGRSHGMAIHYYHKGSKFSETPYVDGHHHGADIMYNEDGSKRREIVYKNGKKISRKEF